MVETEELKAARHRQVMRGCLKGRICPSCEVKQLTLRFTGGKHYVCRVCGAVYQHDDFFIDNHPQGSLGLDLERGEHGKGI